MLAHQVHIFRGAFRFGHAKGLKKKLREKNGFLLITEAGQILNIFEQVIEETQ